MSNADLLENLELALWTSLETAHKNGTPYCELLWILQNAAHELIMKILVETQMSKGA